jgi:hypothetical protein
VNERARRLGENEVLYREVNERVLELQNDFGIDDGRTEFVCECARLDCTERISMTTAEYEEVRADPARFAVVHGHQIPEIEDVVEERERYLVIEKRPGGPAELAASADPRDD